MRKMTMFKVDEIHKRDDTTTRVTLKSDGYLSNEGISGGFDVVFHDQFAPGLGDRLIVMIETTPDLGPRTFSEATGDNYKKYLEQRRGEIEGAIPDVKPSRKFR